MLKLLFIQQKRVGQRNVNKNRKIHKDLTEIHWIGCNKTKKKVFDFETKSFRIFFFLSLSRRGKHMSCSWFVVKNEFQKKKKQLRIFRMMIRCDKSINHNYITNSNNDLVDAMVINPEWLNKNIIFFEIFISFFDEKCY